MMVVFLWDRLILQEGDSIVCLGIQMKVIEIKDEFAATVELEGVKHEVNLMLLEGVKLHDFVIVHAGFAIEKLNVDEAELRISLFEEMASEYKKD